MSGGMPNAKGCRQVRVIGVLLDGLGILYPSLGSKTLKYLGTLVDMSTEPNWACTKTGLATQAYNSP